MVGQSMKTDIFSSFNSCHFYWKSSSWRFVIVLRCIKIALTVSIETYKKCTQLVSTSNKKPSSGEMKSDQKRSWGDGLDTYFDQRWSVKIKIHTWLGVSVPYFPGLSESFKKIFKYTAIQVCFKGVNTLKSLLMHPKDKVTNEEKKDVVYH